MNENLHKLLEQLGLILDGEYLHTESVNRLINFANWRWNVYKAGVPPSERLVKPTLLNMFTEDILAK